MYAWVFFTKRQAPRVRTWLKPLKLTMRPWIGAAFSDRGLSGPLDWALPKNHLIPCFNADVRKWLWLEIWTWNVVLSGPGYFQCALLNKVDFSSSLGGLTVGWEEHVVERCECGPSSVTIVWLGTTHSASQGLKWVPQPFPPQEILCNQVCF